MEQMAKYLVHGHELAYKTSGDGDPVLFMHCGFIADSFAPLLNEPTLTERYRLINYHRRGYGQSAPVAPPYSIEQQAQDAVALLRALDVDSAHVVGHSFGANVAIQMALSAPETVASLTLIEPLLGFFLTPDSLQFLMTTIGEAIDAFGRGEKQAALDTWLNGAFGPGWQAVVNSRLDDGYAQAIRDVDTAIAVEAPSTQTWAVTPQHLGQIRQPVLVVVHHAPAWSGFQEIHDGLLASIPNAASLVVHHATHLMQIQNPRDVALGLADFFERYPVAVGQSR
jgi:pimeloyl-ACP methyl ester carboxylesterase